MLRLLHILYLTTFAVFLLSGRGAAAVEPSPFTFERTNGAPAKIRWLGENGLYYDLLSSENLSDWGQVDGFPKLGTGAIMEELPKPANQQFYRMASSPDLPGFFLPEVAAYKAATGITVEAASEINQFLRRLRGAGVEPVLFWVGGSRYNSINGSTVRTVIGGNGTLLGSLAPQGERYETFTASQALRFANPLKNASQSRVGFFAGASRASDIGDGGLITGGDTDPRGPRLAAGWGGGNFIVYSQNGQGLAHSGYGGFATVDSFIPYVGGAYDGYYSVLCGLGKSTGSRANPLKNYPLPSSQFPNNKFVNSQDFIDLGSSYFSGKLYFAVVTAADLTDNRRAYELISIPRRSGFGAYGTQTAVVFLGDSILVWSNSSIWNSDGQNPPHKGGGQWNRNSLGLLANATGEGNDAQIEYFEKGAKFALDTRTWDHVYFVCGSGGHYTNGEHYFQNPLTQEAKDSIDAWVREAHERIAIPASQLGATVVQMAYIYGCPQNNTPAADPENHRAFADYLAAKQRETALAAGFAVFDVYGIPQLHEPLPAFYADGIHPNQAGQRLIAQEFAATVANPSSNAPRSLGRPLLNGIPTIGEQLGSTAGNWEGAPTNLTYQWMRDATDIPGATSSSYLPQPADAGSHLSCRVIATNASGSAERTSAHTSAVAQ